MAIAAALAGFNDLGRSVTPTFLKNEILFTIIIHQVFSLARDWSKRVTWANIPQLNIPQFSKLRALRKSGKSLRKNQCWKIFARTSLKLKDITK